MNERIKELTHLAFNEVRTTVDINDPAWKELLSIIVKDNKVLSVFKEKFAELIVRECADLFDPDLRDEHEEWIVRKSILQHFGVKE